MVEYNKLNGKLSELQLSKSKTAVNNQIALTLKLNFKMFQESNLPHELLLPTWQNAKVRNAFENTMPTGIRLSTTQISK